MIGYLANAISLLWKTNRFRLLSNYNKTDNKWTSCKQPII